MVLILKFNFKLLYRNQQFIKNIDHICVNVLFPGLGYFTKKWNLFLIKFKFPNSIDSCVFQTKPLYVYYSSGIAMATLIVFSIQW